VSELTRVGDDVSVVAGRTFARTAADGLIDGSGERGIYAEDLRLLRRVEAYRAEREIPVTGTVTVGSETCAVRFELPDVEPGTGVLLVAEVDGTDLFTAREFAASPDMDVDRRSVGGLGGARPDARVRLEVHCEGANLVSVDGVALSDVPVMADGTPRTASWRWDVPTDAPAPVAVTVELRAAWALSSDDATPPVRTFASIRAERHLADKAWLTTRPRFGAAKDVAAVVERSVLDLASLRLPVEDGCVLAAGVPWYLTVFGRDALIAAWMALPIDPELAAATLRHLARHQATDYDLATDAEPGKVQHEERRGFAARRWHERYYGTVDATPLFVMLLAEYTRWTGDVSLARELEQPARSAIAWISSRIDEDELGLLGFWRRAERGLDVQSWKDSPDSQKDHAGRAASGLIRPIEAQGYAIAALRGAARLASSAWNDEVLGSEWNADARLLERRVVDRYLVELPPSQLEGEEDPRRGGYLAQAVDAGGLPLDALCSNVGHLLWSEAISDPSLRGRTIAQLSSPALDSGWGVRTMSVLDDGYEATSYHCGSVWPHDAAICIAGIARYDRETAARMGRNLFDAATMSGAALPELFAGTERGEGDRPERLEIACSPQAWAAGAPLLVLRSLLGLEPDANGSQLTTVVNDAPAWLAGLKWRGVQALGTRWDVEVGKDLRIHVAHAIG
jgi:glycogen debranching enzyme